MDHARRVRSEKRGGGLVRVELLENDGGTIGFDERLLAIDEALTALHGLDDRAAKAIELRFFGGLNEEDAAEALGISVATLKRDWDFARGVGRGPAAVIDFFDSFELNSPPILLSRPSGIPIALPPPSLIASSR